MEAARNELANKLIQYVNNCQTEFERDMVLRVKDSKDWFLAQALLSLYNSGIEQTKAVAICVTKGYATAARTCLRGLVEISFDVRLMLDYGNPYENAVRFLSLSSLELKKILQKGNTDNIKLIEPIEINLKEYKDLFPDAVMDIENNFLSNERTKHWSGLSYKKRLSKIKGATFDGLDLVYGVLSWDIHSRMVVYRSKFEIKDQRLKINSIEEDNLYLFEQIIDITGIIFNNLSSAIFSSPVIIDKLSE